MKFIFGFILGGSLFCSSSFAQDVPPYMLNDPKAITIDSNVIKLLQKEKWYLDVATEFIHNRLDTLSESKMQLGLSKENLFDVSEKEKVYGSGGWCIIAKKAIWLSYDTAKNKLSSLDKRPAGSFIIYEISDSSLLLCRTLTSSGNWKKYYRFVRGKAVDNAWAFKSKTVYYNTGATYGYQNEKPFLKYVNLDSIAQKYPEGITKEVSVVTNMPVTRYYVIKEKKATVYEKLVYDMGKTYYYKNNVTITASEFQLIENEYEKTKK